LFFFFFVFNTFSRKLVLLNLIVRLFFFVILELFFYKKNPTLNYAPIILLSTKRQTPNLTNSFVEKIQFFVKIYAKKLKTHKLKSTEKQKLSKRNTFLILIQIQKE